MGESAAGALPKTLMQRRQHLPLQFQHLIDHLHGVAVRVYRRLERRKCYAPRLTSAHVYAKLSWCVSGASPSAVVPLSLRGQP